MITRLNKIQSGFALIEVLIASAILSMVLLSVYSGISTGLDFIANSRNYTKAIIISKSLMNEFRKDNMRGVDIKNKPVPDLEGFTYDRITERYENPLFGPLSIKRTEITVKWDYRGRPNNISLSILHRRNL